jgi:CBS domain-containing protein
MKILSNPAQYTELQGKPNVRRVGVISEEGKLIGMISQFGMIDFLTKIIKDSSFFVKVKMSELPLVKEQATIYTINEKELAIEGFKMMLDKSISGLGVVDDKGHLTCVFSSCDIKRENSNQELFIDLRETVKDYLSKSTMYCKKIEVQSFQTRSNDSFVNVLEKIIINHLHQIFELDENNTPIKEYSLCDLIRIFL